MSRGGPPALAWPVLRAAMRRASGLVARAATAALAGLLLVAALPQAQAQEAQPLDTTLREQVLFVPAGGLTEPTLEVTLFMPPGEGPFPVAVINHGRASGNAKLQPRYRPLVPVRELLRRGWLVAVPMRQGFSQSGGFEVSGGCNVASNGLQQARSVRRTLDWLATLPQADVSRNIVLGQSHGGLTTMAYGTDPHPGTRLLVNFAGGLRNSQCTAWEQDVIAAFGDYGARTRLPSLWFYGDNDSYFPPFVWQGAHARYTAAGGRAELVAFGNFGSDAHAMFGSRAGLPIWLPRLEAALGAAGLPAQPVVRLPVPPGPPDITPPPPSAHAAVDDLDKLPRKSDRMRQGYQSFLAAKMPRAFAIHPETGSWGWATLGERPYARALANCERQAKAACLLYAVDDTVVWAP